jgi:hypothetical protein
MRRDNNQISSDRAKYISAKQAGRNPPEVREYEPVSPGQLQQVFSGGQPQPVSGGEQQSWSPKLVILQTCYGDASDGGELSTVAEAIVDANVPAVLAMHYDIEREAADKLADKLYEYLIEGANIDVAVGEARAYLLSPDVPIKSRHRAFGTPVIYIGHGGPLVKKRPQGRPNLIDSTLPKPATSPRRCPACGQPDCMGLFCPDCGRALPLTLICWNCGVSIKATAKYCEACGSPAQRAAAEASDFNSGASRADSPSGMGGTGL